MQRDVDKLKSSMLDKVNRRLEAIGQMMKEEEQQQGKESHNASFDPSLLPEHP